MDTEILFSPQSMSWIPYILLSTPTRTCSDLHVFWFCVHQTGFPNNSPVSSIVCRTLTCHLTTGIHFQLSKLHYTNYVLNMYTYLKTMPSKALRACQLQISTSIISCASTRTCNKFFNAICSLVTLIIYLIERVSSLNY